MLAVLISLHPSVTDQINLVVTSVTFITKYSAQINQNYVKATWQWLEMPDEVFCISLSALFQWSVVTPQAKALYPVNLTLLVLMLHKHKTLA